jgi:hypothetical protein
VAINSIISDLIAKYSQDVTDTGIGMTCCAKVLKHLPYLNKRKWKSRYNISAFANIDMKLGGMTALCGGAVRKITHHDYNVKDPTRDYEESR